MPLELGIFGQQLLKHAHNAVQVKVWRSDRGLISQRRWHHGLSNGIHASEISFGNYNCLYAAAELLLDPSNSLSFKPCNGIPRLV